MDIKILCNLSINPHSSTQVNYTLRAFYNGHRHLLYNINIYFYIYIDLLINCFSFYKAIIVYISFILIEIGDNLLGIIIYYEVKCILNQ